MTEMTLTASPRDTKGKGAMRKLRQAGMVPGVIYGKSGADQYSLLVQLDAHEASRMVSETHGSERLITLRIEDGAKGGEKSVLLKEVQTTAVGHTLVHIDFHEVDVSQAVQVSVEVHGYYRRARQSGAKIREHPPQPGILGVGAVGRAVGCAGVEAPW